MTKKSYGRAEDYLTDGEKAQWEEAARNLAERLEKIDLDPATKDEYFKTIMTYEKNYAAATSLKESFDSITREMLKYKELYEKEPNDQKAQQYLNKFHSLDLKRNDIRERYYYFLGMCEAMKAQAGQMNDYIMQEINGPSEDEDKSLDNKPKVPKKI